MKNKHPFVDRQQHRRKMSGKHSAYAKHEIVLDREHADGRMLRKQKKGRIAEQNRVRVEQRRLCM